MSQVNTSPLRSVLEAYDGNTRRNLVSLLTTLRVRFDYGNWSTQITVSSGNSIVKYVNDRGAIRDTFSEGYQAVRITNHRDVSRNFKIRTATPVEDAEVVSLKNRIRKDLLQLVTAAQHEAKGARVSST